MYDLLGSQDTGFEIDRTGRIVRAGESWSRLVGQVPEALPGRRFQDLLYPGRHAGLRTQLYLRLRARQAEQHFAFYVTTPSGEGRLVEVRAHFRYDDEGRFVGATGAMEAAPASHDAYLGALAALHADDAVIVTEAEPLDRPGPRILYVNDVLTRATGYTREELIGQSPRIFQGAGSDPVVLRRIGEKLRRWEPVTEEILNYRKDGTAFWVELSVTPVADGGGFYTHWVAIQRDISARKAVEQALAERDEQYRGLAANLPGAVYRCSYDRAWSTLFMSAQAQEVLGYPPASFVGKAGRSFRDLLHADDVQPFQQAVRKAIATRTAYEVHYRIRHADGSTGWIHDRGRPFFDAEGRVRYLDGVFFDVTAQRGAEERLRMLEAAVQEATESVLVTEAAMAAPGPKMVYVNRGFERMTGYTAEEAMGQTPRVLQGPLTDPDVIERLRQNLAHDEPFFGQTINYRKDGTPFRIEWSINPVIDASGKTTHYVAVQRDITERYRIEERLRLLESAVDSAHDAVAVLTAVDGGPARITYLNSAFTRLNGYTLADMAAGGLERLLGPEADAEVRAQMAALAGGQAVATLDVRTHDRAGTRFWSEFSSACVASNDEGQRHWVVVQRDVTHLRRFEAERAARERAEEMMRAKTSFFNNMSHEIRTPLTAIIGAAEILTMETEGTALEFAQMLFQGGQRLLDTLNSVLDLARLESEQQAVLLQPIRLDERAHQTVEMLRSLADRKGITLDVLADVPGATVLADAAAVDRILTNLIGNAIKFTDRGGVRVEIGAQGGYVALTVRDTGIGMSEAFLPQVFDDFKQESDGLARSHEGSGLGLAITQRLVDLMGGTIAVESEKGVGSAFTVRLPRAPGAPDPAPVAPEAPLRRVLVLEDNPDTRRILGHTLRNGWRADVVPSADAALSLATTQAYDAFVLDINLGAGMSGIDVLQALRELPHAACTPAVALTVYNGSEPRQRFLDAGFDAHVAKPFTSRDLLRVLETLHPHAPGPAGDGAEAPA